jgi:hypothetical protein
VPQGPDLSFFDMDQHILLWGGFLLFVFAMLAVDLGLFDRKADVIHMREALSWTAVWSALPSRSNAKAASMSGCVEADGLQPAETASKRPVGTVV